MKYRNKLNKYIVEVIATFEYGDGDCEVSCVQEGFVPFTISKKDFLEFFEELEVVYEYRFVYQASENMFAVSSYHTTDEAITLPDPREAILFTKRIREQ